MDNTIQYYAVWLKAILKRADGKVLILKVPEWYKQAWFYDFPGWRIDKTEFNVELSDILKREISEEEAYLSVLGPFWSFSLAWTTSVCLLKSFLVLNYFMQSWQKNFKSPPIQSSL